ncbi:MAG: aminodeoxychorismate lyase [Pseudomonadota bacterium]
MRWFDANRGQAPGADDRGLAYGDGLFETMRSSEGRIPWLARHLSRLRSGAQKLGIALPAMDELISKVAEFAAENAADQVVKLLITRGAGSRGYATDAEEPPHAVLSSGTRQPDSSGWHVRVCQTVLPRQPELAGIKHLNRLPQVLARREWHGNRFDEGIMCTDDGIVRCGIMSNVFMVSEGNVVTPRIDVAGVAGVARGWVLQRAEVAQLAFTAAQLHSADEIFATNAVRGIVPVLTIDGARLPEDRPVTTRLMHALNAEWSS